MSLLLLTTSKIIHSIFSALLLALLLLLAGADPPYRFCSESNPSNFTNDTPFNTNLNHLLSSFTSNSPLSNSYNTSIGTDDPLYSLHGLFLCYEYTSNQTCNNCILAASQDIRKLCPNKQAAIVWEEDCQIRYSNEDFFGRFDFYLTIPLYNIQNVSDPDRFRAIVNDTLRNLTSRAALEPVYDMYATEEVPFTDSESIYALVQCTADLSPEECRNCLENAIRNISGCCYFSRGARVLSSSCYLRYEFYEFYVTTERPDSTAVEVTESSDYKKKWKIVAFAIGSAMVVVLLLGSFVYCLVIKNQAKKRERKISTEEGQLHDSGGRDNVDDLTQNLQGKDNLNPHELPFIDMETINAATDNFSDSNKLGQGGFGPVYKGILPDGEEVAVKRLSSNSEQGSDEFINEVQLILKLQHKNLVRLLGFSVHREEKLLIYEYMPNNSLDAFLNDPRKRGQLKWSRRLNIINGIARGTLYLHQDSRLRIIHRDLKPSNVLLDGDMNPKISDFGMARIFGGSDSTANTGKIVGTYGYMAPEFAMEGLYSIKSDVYSFGVLLLEIISGRKNARFHLSKHAPSLVAHAWKFWNEGKGLELMDPLLTDSYRPDEFLRCLHIGLLCVQEDANDRPTMSSVVHMLQSETVTLCQPERPALSVGRFSNHHETCYNNLSINNLTISGILAR